jgi:polo-like kinase 1
MDKKGQLSTYPLNTALDSSNYEMTKRLKYTKQILMHMLTAKSHSNGGQQTTGNMTSSIKHSQIQGNH